MLPLDLVVRHELPDSALQSNRVKSVLAESVVELAPGNTLHYGAAAFRKGRLHPVDDLYEVVPQLGGVRVMLMQGHVVLDVTMVDPLDDGFEVLLTDGRPCQVDASEARGGAAIL